MLLVKCFLGCLIQNCIPTMLVILDMVVPLTPDVVQQNYLTINILIMCSRRTVCFHHFAIFCIKWFLWITYCYFLEITQVLTNFLSFFLQVLYLDRCLFPILANLLVVFLGNTCTILPPRSKEKGSCSNMQKGRIDTHHEFTLWVEVDGWLENF